MNGFLLSLPEAHGWSRAGLSLLWERVCSSLGVWAAPWPAAGEQDGEQDGERGQAWLGGTRHHAGRAKVAGRKLRLSPLLEEEDLRVPLVCSLASWLAEGLVCA